MWKTAAPPMENRYSRPDGKAASFPTARKHRFPQLRLILTVDTHFHSVYYCEYPSCPILIEREKIEKKKRERHSRPKPKETLPLSLLMCRTVWYNDCYQNIGGDSFAKKLCRYYEWYFSWWTIQKIACIWAFYRKTSTHFKLWGILQLLHNPQYPFHWWVETIYLSWKHEEYKCPTSVGYSKSDGLSEIVSVPCR